MTKIELPAFADTSGVRETLRIWEGWRGDALVPNRKEAQLAKLAKFFEATILLQRESDDRLTIRYFGSLFMDYYGEDFTGHNYLDTTPDGFRELRQNRMAGIFKKPCGAVWTTCGVSYGREQEFSVGISLPIASKEDGPVDQMIQVCVPHKGTERPRFVPQTGNKIHVSDKFQYLDIGAGTFDAAFEAR